VAAFRSYAADDAITLSPDPVNAQENLARIPGDGETTLDWRPAYAGIANSGDFGFTTGPFQIRGREGIVGHYFTVWRRQANGEWKWIFDAGTDVRDPGPAVAVDAQIPTLPAALETADSAEAAIAEVAGLEALYTQTSGLISQLAHDARVNRPFAAAAVGRAASVTLMSADGETTCVPLRREAASSGDMVFSLGEARDRHEGVERLRYYARIWQRRPEGRRIVFDEIVPRRGSKRLTWTVQSCTVQEWLRSQRRAPKRRATSFQVCWKRPSAARQP
jgi:ketosteroid isomerase-like protein